MHRIRYPGSVLVPPRHSLSICAPGSGFYEVCAQGSGQGCEDDQRENRQNHIQQLGETVRLLERFTGYGGQGRGM